MGLFIEVLFLLNKVYYIYHKITFTIVNYYKEVRIKIIQQFSLYLK
jgi:hypothetical protein